MTQKDSNPFKYSDSNKRYYTYDYYLRRTFGGKCAKIPIDCSFTCPNIDGKCGHGGCIYCSSGSSGALAEKNLSIYEQYKIAREKLKSKWNTDKCIPYLQAHTNTYAPLDVLRQKYEEALSLDGVVGLNIATRADCLPDDVVSYLAEIAERTVLTVELGLQSVHDSTAKLINRGHTFDDFLIGYNKLRTANKKINICIHLIFALPGEDDKMMLESVQKISELHPEQVKFHYLYVIKGTPLDFMYKEGNYQPIEREKYVSLVCDAIELLPPDTVVARLTGDGIISELVSPVWGIKKTTVINEIDKLLYVRNSYQGIKYKSRQI